MSGVDVTLKPITICIGMIDKFVPSKKLLIFIPIFQQIIQIWTKWWWLTWLISSHHLPKNWCILFCQFTKEKITKIVTLTKTYTIWRLLYTIRWALPVETSTCLANCLTRLIGSLTQGTSAVSLDFSEICWIHCW